MSELAKRIDGDIKTAMLAGDKKQAELLRGLKSAFLYEAVSLGVRDQGLNERQCQTVLKREAKKRSETIELYKKAGETDRAAAEQSELELINKYLPDQLDETELTKIIKKHIEATGASGLADIGKVIGAVKAETGASADGAVIARLVKENLGQ